MKQLAKRLEDKQLILTWDNQVSNWLANNGYDPIYGARPLKRVIQRAVQDPLAMKILEGSLKSGEELILSQKDDGLSILQNQGQQAA